MEGITVAYSGVHQAFQLALAAAELERLDVFFCSLCDAPGKWGRLASRLFGAAALTNRRCNGIPAAKVRENPWPWVAHTLKARLRPALGQDWLLANDRFDRWVAGRLADSSSRVLVTSETCAEHSLRVAGQLRLKRVLDCPQWHPAALQKI